MKSILLLLLAVIVPTLALAAPPSIIRVQGKPSKALGSTRFGPGLALSHKFLVVGSPAGDFDDGTVSGRVDVYDAVTGKWLRALKPLDRTLGMAFGQSVAISGDLVVVGAPLTDGGKGSVYTFNVKTGKQVSKFVYPMPGFPQLLGYSVAIQGLTVVAGAPDGGSIGGVSFLATLPGKAAVFRADANILLQDLVPADGAVSDFAGTTVAFNGGIAAIGATGAAIAGNAGAGAVYTFDLATGDQQTKYSASNPLVIGRFGRALTAAGTGFLVGSSQDFVYLIDCQTQSEIWRIDAPLDQLGQSFGRAVAVSGSLAVVSNIGTGSSPLNLVNLATGTVLGSLPFNFNTLQPVGSGLAMCGSRVAVTSLDDLNEQSLPRGAVYLINSLTGPEPLTQLTSVKAPLPGNVTAASIKEAFTDRNGGAMLLAGLSGADSNGGKDTGFYSDFLLDSMMRIAKSRVQLADWDPLLAAPEMFTPSAIFNVRANLPGITLFQATLTGTGINSGNNSALCMVDLTPTPPISGSVTIIRRTGQEATGVGTPRIKKFAHVAQSHDTLDTFVAISMPLQVGVAGVTPADDTSVAIMNVDGYSSIVTRAREGSDEDGPGGSAVLWGEIQPFVAFPYDMAIFTAARQAPPAENQGLFGIDATGLRGPILKKGELPFPGAPVQTVIGGNANSLGHFVARTTLTSASTDNEAIIFSHQNDIRKGDDYPGSVPTVQWHRFISTHVSRGDNWIIHGAVRGNKVTAANDGVVMLLDSSGEMVPLLREGDAIPGGDGAKVGTILKVDALPGSTAGHYFILVSLVGGASDANQALLHGTTAFGSNVKLTPKLPYLRLRKGQLVDHPVSGANKIRSISFPGNNLLPSGMGGTGMCHWIDTNGAFVTQIEWDNKVKELVRAEW